MEEMSQLSCMGSGNKLQRQKSTWSSGKSKAKIHAPGGRRGKGSVCSRERVCWGKKGVGKGAGVI